jgi:hypothetical protein
MRILIRNIQTLVSGDIRRPLLDADSIEIEGDRPAGSRPRPLLLGSGPRAC